MDLLTRNRRLEEIEATRNLEREKRKETIHSRKERGKARGIEILTEKQRRAANQALDLRKIPPVPSRRAALLAVAKRFPNPLHSFYKPPPPEVYKNIGEKYAKINADNYNKPGANQEWVSLSTISFGSSN